MGNTIKAMPLKLSFLYFGIPALYFWMLTHYLTPYLNNTAGTHPAMSWFITGFFIFIPLFCAAYVFAKKEGNAGSFKALLKRLRLKKLTKKDWAWAIGGLVATLVCTGLIMGISTIVSKTFGIPALQTTPDFLEFEPFKPVKDGCFWYGFLCFSLTLWARRSTGEDIYCRGRNVQTLN